MTLRLPALPVLLLIASAALAGDAPRVVDTGEVPLRGVIDPSKLPLATPAALGTTPRVIPNVFPDAVELPHDAAPPVPVWPSSAQQGVTFASSATATACGGAANPAVDVAFDAPYDGGLAPPDPVMAVGSNHVVSLVNLQIGMFNKSGALVQGPYSLASFFGIPAGWGAFDPLAIYDPYADRFIVATLADNGTAQDSRLYVAFSQTADATGLWNKYFIQADAAQPANWADYASVGLDRYAVYFTANMFARSGGFSNVTVFMYSREDGYAGVPLRHKHLVDVRTSGNAAPYRLRPAFMPETAAGDPYFLCQTDASFGSVVNVLTITGPRFTAPVVTASTVALPGTFFPVGKARQPGSTGHQVATLGTNLWNVFYRGGKLWTAQSVNGSSGLAAQVHRINVATTPYVREQTVQVETASKDVYFPHVVPDTEDNDFALVTAFSSATDYVTGHYFNVAAAGSVRCEQNIINGVTTNVSDRHGDYFAIGVDPRDGNRLYMIAQYMKNSTFAGNSIIGSVRFENTPAPTSPRPVPDGKKVGGSEATVSRASGGNVTVNWDAAKCSAAGNHLVWYDLAAISSYLIKSVTCGVGTSGAWTGAPPSGNVGVVVVSDDGLLTEGSYGPTSTGKERPSWTNACGFNTKRIDGTCP